VFKKYECLKSKIEEVFLNNKGFGVL